MEMGNGESIKIWEHKWLPKLSNSKVVSPRTDTNVIFVKDLFLAGRRVGSGFSVVTFSALGG